jgi:Uma2 family endonuclease
MSPAQAIRARFQGEIAALLKRALGGVVYTECPVATPQGLKVADLAWNSAGFAARYMSEDVFSVAPEICVEIRSPSNATVEVLNTAQLYLDAGAREVWLVAEDGTVEFHDVDGQKPRSAFGVDLPPLLEPQA